MSERRDLAPFEAVSLSHRTRDALLEAARSGAFPDGRLPTEQELAIQLGVSRTTIRAALQSLEEEGLVSRRRRHGTYINAELARSSMRLNRLLPFTDLIEQAGFEASVDPQDHLVRPAVGSEAASLGIPEGAKCLIVDRVLRADGQPVIAMTDVVPLARLRVSTDAIGHADSTFAFLVAHGSSSVEYATSDFIPRVARRSLPRHLQIAAGTAYIELVEIHFDLTGSPIAKSTVSVDDRAVRLSLVRRQS